MVTNRTLLLGGHKISAYRYSLCHERVYKILIPKIRNYQINQMFIINQMGHRI